MAYGWGISHHLGTASVKPKALPYLVTTPRRVTTWAGRLVTKL